MTGKENKKLALIEDVFGEVLIPREYSIIKSKKSNNEVLFVHVKDEPIDETLYDFDMSEWKFFKQESRSN